MDCCLLSVVLSFKRQCYNTCVGLHLQTIADMAVTAWPLASRIDHTKERKDSDWGSRLIIHTLPTFYLEKEKRGSK